MAIEVTFNPLAEENRPYAGVCPSCRSEMNWVRADAKIIVEGDGMTPAHSIIDCPVLDANGAVCGTEVTGRLM